MQKDSATGGKSERGSPPPSDIEFIACKFFDSQRRPDQSSATRMESLGLDASYLMLAGWPATRRSSRTNLCAPLSVQVDARRARRFAPRQFGQSGSDAAAACAPLPPDPQRG